MTFVQTLAKAGYTFKHWEADDNGPEYWTLLPDHAVAIYDNDDENPELFMWCVKEIEKRLDKDSLQINNVEWPNSVSGEIDGYAIWLQVNGKSLEFSAKTMTQCAMDALAGVL